MGRIIKRFNFINEPYIIYPQGKPLVNDEDPFEENEKETLQRNEVKPDEEKLKAIYDDAFKKGMEEGFSQGRDTGLREGKIEGKRIGREEGFNLGYRDGLEKGEKEGFEKGYQEGLKKGEEEFSKIISSFTNAISELKEKEEKFIEDVQQKLLNFAFKFAEVVVKREVEKNDNTVIDVLKEALQYIVLNNDIIIKVNISDIEKTEEYINSNLSLLERDINISVIGDESLEKGSVVIIGPSGEIDAKIEEMIKRTKESLLG